MYSLLRGVATPHIFSTPPLQISTSGEESQLIVTERMNDRDLFLICFITATRLNFLKNA